MQVDYEGKHNSADKCCPKSDTLDYHHLQPLPQRLEGSHVAIVDEAETNMWENTKF